MPASREVHRGRRRGNTSARLSASISLLAAIPLLAAPSLLASISLLAALASLSMLLGAAAPAQQPAGALPSPTGHETAAAIAHGFLQPPDDARILMRWWWFGPAVVKPELQREILAMKAGGIGGFEIQPVYPMALDDTAKNFRNLPYLSDGFIDAVRFANQTALANGMRVDMTLASGWPYGGSYVPIDHASGRLRIAAVDLPSGADSLAVPALENGESLIAAFAGAGSAQQYEAASLHRVDIRPTDGRMALPADSQPRVVVFYIASRTGQQVKRAAVDADGFVLDHYSRAAIDDHLKIVGDRLLQAFGDHPPFSVFSDSLEVYGADWTDNLLAEFQRRRGYDLTPYLPELASGTGDQAAELRHDWGLTLTELADDNYLAPLNAWAAAHGTRFRSQTYGLPPVSLSSNRLVALPEGEGPQWNQFSFMRWASSASHLYGRPITSGETFTWLHSPAFRATPLDMKAEADRFFLEGENQIVGHGWPYTPPGVAEPGWSFYAAAVFNDHNPWYIVMPDVTRYLQRMSYLLRQGEPDNDVAVLLPDDDVYSEFSPAHPNITLSGGMSKFVTPELMQQILSAGHNVDFIDADAIARVGIHYPLLVLPHVERLSPATLQSIAAFVAAGGKVIAVGSTPGKSPGFHDAAAITAQVQQLSHMLFANTAATQTVAGDSALGAAVQHAIPADMQLTSGSSDVGFLHRKLDHADLYFIANTANHPVDATATFRAARAYAASLDTTSGEATALDPKSIKSIALSLAPYESRVIVFSDTPIGKPSTAPSGQPQASKTYQLLADLSHDWHITFAKTAIARTEPNLTSWTDDPHTRFYSGVATYSKTLHLTAAQLSGAHTLTLDFGQGTPTESNPRIRSGMHALLDGPIRDAAVVTVNGQRAGSVWHPPYTLDVTGKLHAGDNTIAVQVANTDINLLAGQSPPDYRLLNARYGERFTPQDTKDLQPLPSGMLGPIHLLETK
jgi:hypothetical protein